MEIKENITQIKNRIRAAAEKAGRDPETVTLIAVSKKKDAEKVVAAIAAGIDVLGENYIQESRGKIEQLSHLAASWHFIGHLQSNKAKYAVRLFDLIHTVDSLKLARQIDREAAKIDKIQDVLLQINISGEKSKAGTAPEAAADLLQGCNQLASIAVQGLMTMPPYFDDPESARPFFKALRKLRDTLNASVDGLKTPLAQLSMGMSGDFEAAIAEGATLVRVGTAIFGARL